MMCSAKGLLDWFAKPAPVEKAAIWTPCGHCGQQGRIYVSDGIGGLISGLCPWCLGVRETIR